MHNMIKWPAVLLSKPSAMSPTMSSLMHGIVLLVMDISLTLTPSLWLKWLTNLGSSASALTAVISHALIS